MKLVLLLVTLTALYTANCRDQDSNIEALLFPDEPANADITGEDQLFPDEQVDDASIGETQRVPIGPENQNIDEEVQQMKENYEMGSVSDHWSSMTKERKRCIPTPLCTRAGGYCVKKSSDCNGMLDSYGCRGSKKCKCCIPDDIICGLAPTTVEPTTTSVTTTAAPTTITPVTTTTAPTTTTPVTTTAAPTTTTLDTTSTVPTTTTAASTTITSGPTGSANLSVGSDRFAIFQQDHTWNGARNLCRRHGLDLYQPRNSTIVSKYLEENFSKGGSLYLWLGARGNGTHMVWISGDVLTAEDPWISGNYFTQVQTDSCLWMVANSGWYASGKGVLVAQSGSCIRDDNFEVLCG